MAELLAEDRKDFMKLFLIILGINILIFLIVFVFCACKVASLCDKEMEKIKNNSIPRSIKRENLLELKRVLMDIEIEWNN